VLLAVAACGSVTAPSAGQHNGSSFTTRARQVIADWDRSPISKVWRAGVVLLSADELVSIPSSAGFASQRQKEEFGDGRFRLSGRLPAAALRGQVRWDSGETASVPALTALATFRELATNAACTVPPCGEMTVTAASPSVLTVGTSRGPATVPAWKFTVSGLDFPVTRAALAPGSYSSLPAWPRPGVTAWSSGASVTRVSGDGRVLTLLFDTGVCVSGWGGLVYETPTAVVIGSWARNSTADGACPAMAAERYAPVRLTRTLGSRVILDAGTGLPVVPGTT
jgi:hypothetical protein